MVEPMACAWAANAYWDPKEECVKNQSDKMLAQVLAETDDLYWISHVPPPLLKCKHNQADKESLDDLISTVKMAASKNKKQLKSAIKSSTMNQQKKMSFEDDKDATLKDTAMVASYNTMISQLTKQDSII